MRAMWRGAVTFGLVNVPVKLYSATQSHDVGMHQVHDADKGRIRYQRMCELCGQPVPYENIDKAVEEGGSTVVLTEEDLAALPVERSREIEVVEFVPKEQVDPIRFDRSYFLEPDTSSPKAYVLLRTALERTERTAIVTVSLRQRSQLGALRSYGDVLMLQTLLWDDEVRVADFSGLHKPVKISDAELSMSAQLVDALSSDFTPDKFKDEYQKQLRTLIEAKLEQGDSIDTTATFGEAPEPAGGGEVIDLMEALRRSVAASRGVDASTEAADDGAASETKPARKAAAKTVKPHKTTSPQKQAG